MTMGDAHRRITLDVLPTLCTLWLMPLLQEFTETHPHIELRIDSSLDPVDFRARQVDVAIRVGRLPGGQYAATAPRIDLEMAESWKDVQADFLFPDVLVPVMSRKLLSQGRPVNGAADVLHYRLIHTANRKHAWGDWLAYHRLGLPARAPSLDFGHFFMAIRAAKDCKGIAIVPRILLESVLADTEMVCPLDSQLESAGAYYMLTRQSSTRDLAVQEIRRWVLSVAKRFFSRAETESASNPSESPSTKGILWPK
jgi:LysR family glycine cleavage system transcriptional activator